MTCLATTTQIRREAEREGKRLTRRLKTRQARGTVGTIPSAKFGAKPSSPNPQLHNRIRRCSAAAMGRGIVNNDGGTGRRKETEKSRPQQPAKLAACSVFAEQRPNAFHTTCGGRRPLSHERTRPAPTRETRLRTTGGTSDNTGADMLTSGQPPCHQQASGRGSRRTRSRTARQSTGA